MAYSDTLVKDRVSDVDELVASFLETRQRSLDICAPLQVEDYGLQAAIFASPPKWHLAHTSWFFETFLLKPFDDDYVSPEPRYEVLFNSYYNGIGEQHPREQRGLLSRPSLAAVLRYRQTVESSLLALLEDREHPHRDTLRQRVTLGVEHERQHQELFFTDIKYSLSANPLFPAYREHDLPGEQHPPPLRWTAFEEALIEIGYAGDGFCFDNELPRHRVFLPAFEFADRLVTNGEYLAFIEDGGYARPELWLADGWTQVQSEGWSMPLHWIQRDGQRFEFTLHGLQPWDAARPVCHVSAFEADAFATWAGARLPTEAEWERAASSAAPPAADTSDGVSSGGAAVHPRAARGGRLDQLYGACWQWTRSAYGPYPGFQPSPGAIGEYNGKFMSNQWVLRGSSCVTPHSQARPSYRNFFYPQDRWQFSGIRLAR